MSRFPFLLGMLVIIGAQAPLASAERPCGKNGRRCVIAIATSGHRYRNVGDAVGHQHRPAYGNYGAGSYGDTPATRGHAVADIVRAQSLANVRNVNALTQLEIVRQARMENSIQEIHVYFDRKAVNKNYRFADSRAKAAARHLENAIESDRQLAGITAPVVGLTSQEWNRTTGTLHWPAILGNDHFAKARQPLDVFFAGLSNQSQTNPEHFSSLVDWVEKIINELEQNRQHPATKIEAASDFLYRMVEEAESTIVSGRGMFVTK